MARIVILGSGVVGKATGASMSAKGHEVWYSDVRKEPLEALAAQGHKTVDAVALSSTDADAYFLCVSTPTVAGHIVLDYLLDAAKNLGESVLKKQKAHTLVVVRSTISPGTTEEKIIPVLEQSSGKKAGKDFGVCMNPEFLREDRAEHDALHPWIVVVGGLDAESHSALKTIYGHVQCPYVELSLKEAEIEKYIHNLFDSCKISFFNEMRLVCEHLGIDADRVFNVVKHSSQASWDADYGTLNLGPFGGSCFPKDTQAFLDWARKSQGMPMQLLQGIIDANEFMKQARSMKQ